MHLIQLLLPLTDNDGRAFPDQFLAGIRDELVDRFGGITAFLHAPAEGVWRQGGNRQRDDIVVIEVMTAALDRPWWKAFRHRLERQLRQEEIVIRAIAFDPL
ncbi:MAG: hypothetical protein JO256_12890 [Alphaproteobacteria bacterium]|nr:hypothetical protein [Alphaproteobacteria bacterium]